MLIDAADSSYEYLDVLNVNLAEDFVGCMRCHEEYTEK